MREKLVPESEAENSAAADKRRANIYRCMSPAQKWEECKRLREAAWKLKVAGVKAMHPDWADQEVESAVRKIFLYAIT